MTFGELLEVLPYGTFIWLTDADTNEVYEDGNSDEISEKYWGWKVHEADPHVSVTDGEHEAYLEVFIISPSRCE